MKISNQLAPDLRIIIRFKWFRAFSFYILQTLWLLIIAFTLIYLYNKLLDPKNFFPEAYDITEIKSGAILDTFWGTLGSLRCGASGIIIGTVVGAISSTIGYNQTVKHAKAEQHYADTCHTNILLLLQIIKIQVLILIGSMVLAPLLWLIIAKYNTEFFVAYEQVLWLYFLYLAFNYFPRLFILPVLLLYIIRVVWQLRYLCRLGFGNSIIKKLR